MIIRLAQVFQIFAFFLVCASEIQYPRQRNSQAIRISDVTAQVVSASERSITDLFGPPRNFTAKTNDLLPGKHPRILFSKLEWEDFINCYADARYKEGTWAKHFLDYTLDKGPGNDDLNRLAEIDTSAYTGEPGMNSTELRTLASELLNMTEYNEGGMFMYTLHTAVNDNLRAKKLETYLRPTKNANTAKEIIVNYAKVVLAHYFTYGCETCAYEKGMKKSDLWNKKRKWFIINDWYTAGLGMALSYDVLYDRMNLTERRTVRSALTLMVQGREHWGITNTSTRGSPNAKLHPHRIFSNWASYHANLHLVNLATEGETDFDIVTSALNITYNRNLEEKTIAVLDAFFSHSIYPDGSSFEDGYMFNLGMREGSLLYIALARRGNNYLDTTTFRNFIYWGSQMMEPWHCGEFVGHSAGGGTLYPTWQALARYVYPRGELTSMLWQQRMGIHINNNNPCRITWHQIMMQMAILGGEHSDSTDAVSPYGLSADNQIKYSASHYSPRRGLLISRTSLEEDAIYAHFDARPDAFFVGHDNADRGVFTMSALGRTWLPDIDWHHFYAYYHSIIHIDGQAQALKAPSVRMMKVKDFSQVVTAAADLTYAYNVQWYRAFAFTKMPINKETVFDNGTQEIKYVQFPGKETGNPRSFGWPADDPATDIGFTDATSLWGEFHIGFSGFFNWKRIYRKVWLKHIVRSFVHVRLQGHTSYLVIGDNIAMESNDDGVHNFESYLILDRNLEISEESTCFDNWCTIIVYGGYGRRLDIHFSALGNNLSYRVETVKKHYKRLVISSKRRSSEQFFTVFHPHYGNETDLQVSRNGSNVRVGTGMEYRFFNFTDKDQSLVVKEEDRTVGDGVTFHPNLQPPLEPSNEPFEEPSAEPESSSEA